MKRSRNLGRRQFLQVAATTASAGTWVSCSRAGRLWYYLTDREAETIGAMCDLIIPPDKDPGAVEAGVVNFIDRQLVGHYSYLQEVYKNGLEEIDDIAAQRHGKPFVEIPFEQQLQILKEIEASSFFRLIRDHTMQGFYGDPRHGGNLDAVSWRMLGIPNPPVRGRDQYEFTMIGGEAGGPKVVG